MKCQIVFRAALRAMLGRLGVHGDFMQRRLLPKLTGLLILLIPACLPAGDERVPVRGKVKFNGQPISGGVIAFAPDPKRNTSDELAVAPIHPDGSYELETPSDNLLAAGWYRVTVVARQGAFPQLPDKYRDPAQSGLECQLMAGHENIVDFNLK